MDPGVIRAMSRWPQVPAVYGWLSLDRRGRWCLRGEPITHRGVVAFINRNYACTGDGQWYFQNGPQRVFADLDYTPWIYTLDGSRSLMDHTGNPVGKPRRALIDEEGNLLLVGKRGIGQLCDRDLAPISDNFRFADDKVCDEESIAALIVARGAATRERIFLQWDGKRIEVEAILRERVAGNFGFEPRPRADDDA